MIRFTLLNNIFFTLTLISSVILLFLFKESDIELHLFAISSPFYVSAVICGIINFAIVPKLANYKTDQLNLKKAYSSIMVFIASISFLLILIQYFLFNYLMANNYLYSSNLETFKTIQVYASISAFIQIINSSFSAFLYYKEEFTKSISINIFASLLHIILVFNYSNSITFVSLSLLICQLIAVFIFLYFIISNLVFSFSIKPIKSFINASISILMSSSSSRFDIVQDRSLLSQSGGIIYFHYARLACEAIATSTSKAFSIIQLTYLSKHQGSSFDNRSFIILITLSVFIYMALLLGLKIFNNLIDFELSRYIDAYIYLYLFLMCSVSGNFLVNKIYSIQLFWYVSIPSTILSLFFIVLKQSFYTDSFMNIIPLFLSTRSFINTIILFVLINHLKINTFNDFKFGFAVLIALSLLWGLLL